MRPLQAIGMGLVLVVLSAPYAGRGVDLFPDPLGWLLVLLGVRRLPGGVPQRPLLLALAALAAVVAGLLWLPATSRTLGAIDASLQWSLELPRVACVAVLALALSRAAGAAQDGRAQGWWRVVLAAAVVTGLLPVMVYGAGVLGLADLAGGVAVATLLVSLVLAFAHSGRPWAGAEPRRVPETDL